MIEWIIRRSVANRFLVMMAALFLSIWGTWTIVHTPVDALPDLSDVQVIVKTRYPGQAPQIVENQVTWPLTTTMLSVPGAKTVRGFSQFGDSYVYVIFEDGTDPYWARSRVLEYLNQVQGKLPAGVSAEMGPDATGVGWVFEYALVDRSGKHDLAELRSLQDWFLKYELKTIPNVSEVASVGGVVKEYQIVVDPMKLTQYGISLGEVKSALDASNQEAGGSSVELAEAEYMVRASGYLQTLDDFKNIVLKTGDNGVPVYLGDVARVQIGPEMRRGIAELNGEGEVAGGVVILRSGKNAREVISAVKAKLASLQSSLPEGVEVVTGPSMLKTENARPTSWIYIDARDRDMVSVVHDLQQAIGKEVKLKPGISVSYSGQFELLERANQKLKLMVPMTLMIIFVLLYLAFRRVGEALLIITSVPFALVGGIWFLYWMGFHLSVATGTGFIALAGVAAEFGVVMLMYLRHAIEAEPSLENPQTFSVDKLDEALYQGAVLRVRPKAMTVAVIIAGLLPILWGTGAGSEVMSRIAAPMIGGMITAPLLSLFIIPAAYKLMWLSRHRGKRSQ
ncbi:efflux RND transporter permease subunit [Klebsiella pneumoniae]|uniref:efflux RND transporter permease subunit n=1 Tax=Klebsiella pneumoniae TaxID=573 RepID=UPI003132E96D